MNTGRQPETVREYLDALQIALKGCPPALIRDALTDAEEHLRNEIIQHPAQNEREVLMDVIDTYGTPEEVAETYQTMEAAGRDHSPKPPNRTNRGADSSPSSPIRARIAPLFTCFYRFPPASSISCGR